MKKVKIYSTNICPYCDKVKDLFDKKNVSYMEINLTGDSEAMGRLVADTGFRTVPQVFIGEKFYGGCDDIYALEKSGQLDVLLSD